jgi:2-desacetyl-2-hydroxyethyl bacteriochlorophyllide A dehydrogenase
MENRNTNMKAIIRNEYGSPEVLRLVDIERPMPAPGEVVVKVHAASINMADRYLMRGKPLVARVMSGGLLRPKSSRLGADVAGEVIEAGRNVHDFKAGDTVFADLAASGFGGFSEYVAVPEQYLAHMPANLSYERAAAVPMAGVTALQAIRDKAQVKAGDKVLVHGASGGVGTFAVQMAKALGAEVTAVCSTRNVEMARALGAEHVIDYTREDFARNGRLYDVIIAANGNRSLADYRRALAPGGVLVVTGGSMSQIFKAMVLGGKRATALSAQPSGADLAEVAALIGSGKISPVIDATYPLAEIATAMRYLEEEHPRGKVILAVNGARP